MTSQAPPVRARKKRSTTRARDATDVLDVIDVTDACHATDDGHHKAMQLHAEPSRAPLGDGDDDWISRLDLPVD